jgi:hypothetical protein
MKAIDELIDEMETRVKVYNEYHTTESMEISYFHGRLTEAEFVLGRLKKIKELADDWGF